MANTLTDVMPKILAAAMQSLRQNIVMPRLVNTSYSNEAAQKGQVIEVATPSAIVAVDVVPASYAPDPGDLNIRTAKIGLDYWQDASFQLSDKEIGEVVSGVIPMQIAEAGKTIANAIDLSIFKTYKDIYNFVGTAGTTPFATSPIDAQNARRILNNAGAPPSDRRMVLDTDADANATGLTIFQAMYSSGSLQTIEEGMIGRKLGFDWYYDAIFGNHTAGTGSGYLINNGAGIAIGSTAAAIDTGTGTLLAGDLFTVAGSTQQFTVVSFASSTLNYAPSNPVAFADNAAITKIASHSINLAFHRDAIGLAIRPLQSSELELDLGGRVLAMTDSVSGIPMRLEVRREYKRVRFSLDALWGVKCIRPETAVRILG